MSLSLFLLLPENVSSRVRLSSYTFSPSEDMPGAIRTALKVDLEKPADEQSYLHVSDCLAANCERASADSVLEQMASRWYASSITS